MAVCGCLTKSLSMCNNKATFSILLLDGSYRYSCNINKHKYCLITTHRYIMHECNSIVCAPDTSNTIQRNASIKYISSPINCVYVRRDGIWKCIRRRCPKSMNGFTHVVNFAIGEAKRRIDTGNISKVVLRVGKAYIASITLSCIRTFIRHKMHKDA